MEALHRGDEREVPRLFSEGHGSGTTNKRSVGVDPSSERE